MIKKLNKIEHIKKPLLSAMIRFFCVLPFVLLTHIALGQSFVLTADASKVVQNSSVRITYTVDGAKGSNFRAPDFGTLEVVGGPSQSTSMTIVNGAMSQTQSFAYDLFATKVGKYTIPAASINIGGKTTTSNSLTIDVVKGTAAGQISADDKKTYVKLETTATEAILGQQITIEYRLYTQQDVNGYDLVNEPDYDGFFSQELRNYRSEVSRIVVDGKEFYTKVIKKIALFPQRTGRFDFAPVTISLAIPIPGSPKPRGFFSSQPTRSKRVQTNPLTLIVTDPPEGAPISFSGAVGKYQMAAKINKTNITTDDAFVINMEVRGTGDGKTFSAPQQPVMDGMEYYDPNVVRDEDTSRDGIVSNYKQIEYLIVPKKAGTYTIAPEFSYYDTDSSRYMTIRTRPFTVQVAQGTRSVVADDRDVSVTQSLLPDSEDLSEMGPFKMRFFDAYWWSALAVSLLALGGMGLYRMRQMKYDNLDPEEKKRRAALALANSKLDQARVHQEAGDSRRFYEEISTTMNGYLGNKYGLPNADFDRDKISAALSGGGVSDALVSDYLSILKTCEMALFAGQPPSKMDEVLSRCTSLILDLEK